MCVSCGDVAVDDADRVPKFVQRIGSVVWDTRAEGDDDGSSAP